MDIPFVAVAFMMLLAVCMFYGQVLYKKKRIEGGKTLTIVCGILIVITAMYVNLFKSPVDQKSVEREKQYRKIQAIALGNALAQKYTGGSGKCLLIHYPVAGGMNKNDENLQTIIEGLKQGFGTAVTEIISVPIKNVTADDEMMLEEVMMENTAEDFNNIISTYNSCDIVISMVSFPATKEELLKVDIFKLIEDKSGNWVKDPKIKYPVVGVYNGYVGNLQFLFDDGLIHAMTIWKPKPEIDENPVPDDLQKAFDKRYLLVNPENIIQSRQEYPKLFPEEKK